MQLYQRLQCHVMQYTTIYYRSGKSTKNERNAIPGPTLRFIQTVECVRHTIKQVIIGSDQL